MAMAKLRFCMVVVILMSGSFFVTLRGISATLSRADFPDDFRFGTASSAYQYEGAAFEDGRKASIWDTFSAIKGNIVGNTNGNVAVDEYHLYKEDISLMSTMGMDSYRLSISWSRIYPDGNGDLNLRGITHYNKLIDSLLEKGIEPFVTLYHWDLPQRLEDEYGAWLSNNIVNDFANYAETCFKYFGDRVKYWTTFNEPGTFIPYGYNTGTMPPQRCSPWMGNCTKGNSSVEPYVATHNMLLSHAKAVQIYRSKFQKQQGGNIGIVLATTWILPYSNSKEDEDAQKRAIDFTIGWFLNPLLYGDYPTTMRKIVGNRLPTFTEKQKKIVQGSLDFIGANYYTTYYARNLIYVNASTPSYTQDIMANQTGERDGVLIGKQAASTWLYIYPQGIYDVLHYMKETYVGLPPIYITENGVDELSNSSLSLNEALKDPIRIKFYNNHLSYLSQAIKEGVNVKGFFAWSLLDNFEWLSGYTLRFGLHYVDFNSLKRYPKDSAKWFKNFLKE